ncbi:DNA-binding protein [Acidovorax sp. JMULE5]|nr:DNA-binding protein [Acidovorax sp. JMULE5]QLA80387.1 DNA-binding protein [Acidovorax sp. JMULE5]
MQTHQTITPIEFETRTVVDTATAAFHLNRRPQTLRVWACYEDGPIRPIRVNGRLAWPVVAIRGLLGCAPATNDGQYCTRA